MTRDRDEAATRLRAAVVCFLGAVLAVITPALLTSPVDQSAALTVAVLSAAVAALVRTGSHGGIATTRTVAIAHSARRDTPPQLTGRATDPVHHPLRPRAPESA